MSTEREIIKELFKLCVRLSDDSDIKCLDGSFDDTLSDDGILLMLKDINAGRPIMTVICEVGQ